MGGSSQISHREEVRMKTFEVGDVVQLKSGGPLMTVTLTEDQTMQLDGGEKIACDWFVNGKHSGAFFR